MFEIGLALAMLFIIAGVVVVVLKDASEDDFEIKSPTRKRRKEESPKEGLCSWIPEEGTVKWAHFVLENYSTEYFKPVDITRAYKILDAEERKKTARK